MAETGDVETEDTTRQVVVDRDPRRPGRGQTHHVWGEYHSWVWMLRWPMFRKEPRRKCIRCGAMLRYEHAGRRQGRVTYYKGSAGVPWRSISVMPRCPGRVRIVATSLP